MNNSQEALVNVEPASLEGLDDVFVSTDDQESISGVSRDDPGTKPQVVFPEGGLKLSEAADKFDVTVRTIQRWIKEGRLIGHKVAGNHGPEWRVMGESSGDRSDDQPVITGVVEDDEDTAVADSLVDPSEPVRADASVERMAVLVEKLTDQLEAARKELQGASFRNGYLEAQLKAREEQIKLLTMSPASEEAWWKRLGRWFIGSGK